MKCTHLHLILISMVLLISGCAGKNQGHLSSDVIHFAATASGQENNQGPAIVFDRDTFSFEMMAVGTSVSHTFNFKNSGKVPLVISHVQPSCGCTALKDWPQGAIAPGESGQITIEFNATGSEGKVDKTILVATNAEPKDKILHIVGNIIGTEVKQRSLSGGVNMKRER